MQSSMSLRFKLIFFIFLISMSQTIDGKTYEVSDLQEIRRQQLDILSKDRGNLEAMCELVCADALLCEEYSSIINGPSWLNAPLCREIALYMSSIIEIGDRNELAENVCERAAETLYHHPRLKLKLLTLQRDAVIAQGGERADDAEMGIDDLSQEISRLQLNIMAADEKRWDDIVNEGHLKRDPVEWTAEFEDAIDNAEEKVDKILKDAPRGMGFCHAHWSALADVLLADYGIRWRSPARMNPRVMFD